jgi:hypothetical protein
MYEMEPMNENLKRLRINAKEWIREKNSQNHRDINDVKGNMESIYEELRRGKYLWKSIGLWKRWKVKEIGSRLAKKLSRGK